MNPCEGEFTIATLEEQCAERKAVRLKPKPPKVVKKRKKGQNPVGRPKGEAGIMKDYRERMLNSPKSRKVLTSILDAALNDDHKNQAAAWKIVIDRIMPVSSFDKIAGQGSRSAITVNITGVEGVSLEQEGDLEGEYVPVEVKDA